MEREATFEAGPINVKFRICEPNGKVLFWYRTALQPVPFGASELGAPSKDTVVVPRSTGEGPLISIYVPVVLLSMKGSAFENRY
jgi:hypothetical protein